ncbi:2-hydroxychromene-2-carboxylate isomerase [Mesorhizobium caraganae]|uniref:2-hydroxychromene-2-carboxylate isomerase n=1 Tax=Mesorhizobium caraganae TaxID=483206 RepID=UPI0017871D21|nr:2-hydroxychromene-2-carboxylate isomerase [Mesorhizobium caraganae]MBM2712941.1 2-hydroxychromene-2-carboxylate isomerase [Mesorhizobium caraganae]
MALQSIDYYFWVLSDWAYFGGPRLASIGKRHGLNINYFPIKMPYVYSKTGGILLSQRSKQRQDYRLAELRRWQVKLGMPINESPKYGTTNEDLASGLIIAAKHDNQPVEGISHDILKAAWVDELDIASPEVLLDLAGRSLNGPVRLLELAGSPAIQEEFRRYSDAAIERGVFGSPFYLFEDEMFWGQDRLDFLEDAVVASKMRTLSKA